MPVGCDNRYFSKHMLSTGRKLRRFARWWA